MKGTIRVERYQGTILKMIKVAPIRENCFHFWNFIDIFLVREFRTRFDHTTITYPVCMRFISGKCHFESVLLNLNYPRQILYSRNWIISCLVNEEETNTLQKTSQVKKLRSTKMGRYLNYFTVNKNRGEEPYVLYNNFQLWETGWGNQKRKTWHLSLGGP